MSKASFILLALFLLAIGAFLYMYTSPHTASFLPAFSNRAETPLPISESVLSFSPNPVSAKAGQNISLDVNLNFQNDLPTVMQLEIGYDPTILTLVAVTPGTFFTDPTILLNTNNPRTGRISYALKCLSNSSDCINQKAKTAAKFDFIINPYTYKSATSVTFLPKTLLQTKENSDVLLQKNDAKIIITNTTPSASPSGEIIQ